MRRSLTTFAVLLIGALLSFAQPPQGSAPGRPAGQGGFMFRAPEKPSGEAYQTKDITITSRGQKIYGLAVIPKSGPAKKPTVIMSHGYGGNCSAFYEQMGQLAEEGYVCYAFDFQGGGRVSQSEGDTRQMSILTEKQNLIDVINTVRTWDFVDTDNIFLCGESQGGCVSAITAPEVADKIKAIALVYPAFCIRDDAKKAYPTKADIPDEVNFMGLQIGRKYYEDVYDYDVYSVIPAFEKDVLIIHGDQDALVNISYSKQALPLYKNVEFHVIDGGGHGFRGDQKTRSNKFISDFFKKEVSL